MADEPKKEQTPAQLERLEKARQARELRYELERQVTELSARGAVLEEIGVIFHDDTLSYTRHATNIRDLRRIWPELYEKLSEAFGYDGSAR